MQAAVHIAGSAELGRCPAATVVDQETGDTLFLVNRDVFPLLGAGEQYFILGHELGHRLTGSESETVADAFALGLTAGRQRRSLKSAVRAVASMQAVPIDRLESLYALCMQVDKKQQTMKKQHLFSFDGSPIQEQAAVPASEPVQTATPASTADMHQAEQDALMLGQLLSGQGLSRRPGVHIGQWFVSAELIGLAALLLCAIVIAARVGRN